ncbi:unnamed protein product, partial [Gongylonema pulchrum]|uniref:Lysophospholipid acyltransferase 2 n=1 Tax=Gongylonema pulchrum TaxID=637853 RepID=A0A183EQX3_9BILA
MYFIIFQINLVVCQLLSLPLAYLHYTILSPANVTRTTRIASPAIIGLVFCYFCFGKTVFLFSMGYLVFIHWYRWYILTTYSIDITGPMMVAVQKVTVLAFSLHDGKVKKSDELNDIQKREALRSVPSVLNFLSYVFHFQSVLVGPLCFYTDYMSWIDGTAAIGKDGK